MGGQGGRCAGDCGSCKIAEKLEGQRPESLDRPGVVTARVLATLTEQQNLVNGMDVGSRTASDG
jgi:hypothetical protein